MGAWERGFFEPFLTDDYARSQHFSAQILTKHVTLEPKVTITIVKPKRIRNGGPENAKPEVRYSVYTKIHIYNKTPRGWRHNFFGKNISPDFSFGK